MNFIKNTLFILSFLLTFNAHALLLVEPHLGYNISGLGQNSEVPAKTVKYYGGQYGLKLGGQYMGGMAGLDYNHSSFEQLTSGWKNSFVRKEWGLFLGYNFPGTARFWMTYYFSYSAKAKNASGLIATGDQYEGHTIELGGGYSGIPYISINMAYRMITLDTYLDRNGTTKLTGNTEIGCHELVLGVSAPFDFF